MRRGILFLQWRMQLLAIEQFSKRNRQMLNEMLGTEFGKTPLDSSFRLLQAQLDVQSFECLLPEWISVQLGVAEELDTLACVGNTLHGYIAESASGAARYGLRPPATPLPSEPVLPDPGRADSPSPLTPPMPVARSWSCASCWMKTNFRVCWCRPTRCMRTALFRLIRPPQRRPPVDASFPRSGGASAGVSGLRMHAASGEL